MGDVSSQEDQQMDQSLILEPLFEEGGGDAMNLDHDDAVVILPITDTSSTCAYSSNPDAWAPTWAVSPSSIIDTQEGMETDEEEYFLAYESLEASKDMDSSDDEGEGDVLMEVGEEEAAVAVVMEWGREEEMCDVFFEAQVDHGEQY